MGFYHTVKQGECLSSITKQYGFADYHTIYHNANNREFIDKRPDPNVIAPGDQLYIPDRQIKEVDGCATDRIHRFVVNKSKTTLRVVLEDENGQPRRSCQYRLILPAGTVEGITRTDGLIVQEIPADLERATLEAQIRRGDDEPQLERWCLRIGHLDPVSEDTGIQARLDNLGFDCGQAKSMADTKAREALKRFQQWAGLIADGLVHPETRARLEAAHRS